MRELVDVPEVGDPGQVSELYICRSRYRPDMIEEGLVGDIRCEIPFPII
jgi:hypothetical protein